jgi:hypothetical protein
MDGTSDEVGLVSTLGAWLMGFFLTYLLFWVVSFIVFALVGGALMEGEARFRVVVMCAAEHFPGREGWQSIRCGLRCSPHLT